MSTRSHPESARIIREARQAAGLTQLELAEKLGVTIGTIGYYERGAGMPKTAFGTLENRYQEEN